MRTIAVALLLLAVTLSGASAACVKNCLKCNARGQCKEEGCKPGYFDMDGLCFRNWPVVPKAGTFKLDIPSRIQYLEGKGYCAEQALQMTAMYYGQWLPQAFIRQVAGGETLPGVNMEAAMQQCRVEYEPFQGQGEGYKDFVQFSKAWIKGGHPVISVAFIPGEKDKDFDHVQPIVGITTKSKQAYDFNQQDVLWVNGEVATKTIKIKVNTPGYGTGTRESCKRDIDIGGCIPKNVFNGFAIIGPTYQGIGPSVRLGTPTFRGKAAMEEPYDPQTGGPYDQWNRRVPFQTWVWTITVSGLTKGQKYTLYKVSDINKVPAYPTSPMPKPGPGVAVIATFTAAGPNYVVKGHQSSSGIPAWYIAVPTPGLIPRIPRIPRT